jgi:hypothetical protein
MITGKGRRFAEGRPGSRSFETIIVLDGNGRLGRLLITLLLCEQKVLKQPLLYLSLYFKNPSTALL